MSAIVMSLFIHVPIVSSRDSESVLIGNEESSPYITIRYLKSYICAYSYFFFSRGIFSLDTEGEAWAL